jgi:hydrogenase maturation protease
VGETALVVGLGHPDRGDDAVGSLVVARLHRDVLPGVQVRHLLEPTRLTDVWGGYDLVVVVDAASAPGNAGEVRVYDAGAGPLPADLGGAVSSHGVDLPAVVETARLLHVLPPRLLVLAVTGSHVGVGDPPSPAVRAAVEGAAERVRALLSRGTPG